MRNGRYFVSVLMCKTSITPPGLVSCLSEGSVVIRTDNGLSPIRIVYKENKYNLIILPTSRSMFKDFISWYVTKTLINLSCTSYIYFVMEKAAVLS